LWDAYHQALPLEAVGFLLGSPGQESFASEVALVRGAAGARGEFAVPDYELRRVRAWADDRNLGIVALFHSHRSGDARLSRADEAALRHSEWPWVIVTRAPGRSGIRIAAYRPPDAQEMTCEIERADKSP
jgi:proteasome lid subunit RPN8/RPN11